MDKSKCLKVGGMFGNVSRVNVKEERHNQSPQLTERAVSPKLKAAGEDERIITGCSGVELGSRIEVPGSCREQSQFSSLEKMMC